MDEPLSCKNIFQRFSNGEVPTDLVIYVHFSLVNAAGVNVPFSPCLIRGDDPCRKGELFHLLLVAHKFPATNNVCLLKYCKI